MHHKKREYLETLGVSADADEETVKRAYRKLALEFHPDRPNNKGKEHEASTMFNKINEAYEGLQSNSQTINFFKNQFKSQEIRSSVEQFIFTTGKSTTFSFGSSSNSKEFNNQASSSPINPSTASNNANNAASNLGSNTKRPKNGQSLQTVLKIAFQECVAGCAKTIEFNVSKLCTSCSGNGRLWKSKPVVCKDCEGKGTILKEGSSGSMLSIPCMTCSRATSQIETCLLCNGTGRMSTRKTSTIQVPPGVFSGMKKIYEGEGDEGENGGSNGDLIICFEIESHPFFTRPNGSGDDVHCTVSLPFPHVALGCTIEVPTMYGKKLQVTLAPATQHEHVIKIQDEGFWNVIKQKRGDMYIRICVEVPRVLDEAEQNLLRKLATLPNFVSLFPTTLPG